MELPSMLEDDELDDFKRRLGEFMPLDSIIIDLWDWDIHFESELCDDWSLSAAFGRPGGLDSCSADLADFFPKRSMNMAWTMTNIAIGRALRI